MTGEEEDPEQREPAAPTMLELDVQFVRQCRLLQEFVLTEAEALRTINY